MYQPITGTGNGTAPVVNLTWPFIDRSDIQATVGGVPVTFSWTGASQITFDAAVTAGAAWAVIRNTSLETPAVDFTNGAVLTELDLDTALSQLRYSLQEAIQLGQGGDAQLRIDLADPEVGASLTSFDPSETYSAGSVGDVLDELYGDFQASPNYVGSGPDSTFIIAQGSALTPKTTQGASLLVEKHSNTTAFNALAAAAYKHSSATDARATAFFSEATDEVGGSGSFVEGSRPQAILRGGSDGAAYGQVSVAGTTAAGPTNPKYLIGHESEVDDQVGTDSLSFTSFDATRYKAGYVATNGLGSGTRKKSDAAFITNPFSMAPWRTGLLLTENSVDHTGIAFRTGLSLVDGINMAGATFSDSPLKLPHNKPVKFRKADATDAEGLKVDPSNILQIAAGLTGVKLNGTVSFGTLTGNADAPVTGYITITDAGGVSRKLAVIA